LRSLRHGYVEDVLLSDPLSPLIMHVESVFAIDTRRDLMHLLALVDESSDLKRPEGSRRSMFSRMRYVLSSPAQLEVVVIEIDGSS
jgi:hypothetical protein